jgi:hypothetical protein
MNLNEFSNDQDIEACAVTLYNVCILSIYRAHTRKFTLFINKLDTTLTSLYITNLQFIICSE